jgi:tRNA(Ile)-lysidine synthase
MQQYPHLPDSILAYTTAIPVSLRHKRILIGVSGGVDSMVLLHCLHQLGVDIGVAHVNYGLRGTESDADAALVQSVAQQYQVPHYTIHADTQDYVTSHKVSIQLAAREIRYDWLEQMRIAHKYDYIATAHHLQDNIETVLHNFIKSTGVKGLRGMLPLQGRILRPMLETTKDAIISYAKNQSIAYRDDSSNATTKYTRNKIRLELLPLIKEINPGFEQGFEKRLKVFADLEAMYTQAIHKAKKQLFLLRAEAIYIPILKIKRTPQVRTVLYEYLSDYGYNAAQVDDILAAIDGEPGAQYLSDTHTLVRDRRFMILTAHTAALEVAYIDQHVPQVTIDKTILHLEIRDASTVDVTADKSYAYLDADKLEYPLALRSWRVGDYFYPLGMGMKKKKISKYFKDLKLAIHQKQKMYILESNQKIVWLVGERIDERYRVKESTQRVLVLRLAV